MKTYTFGSWEILAITAGQLIMYKYENGASQEFMDFCLGRVNYYIAKENANIVFKAEKPNVEFINLHYLPNEIVYYYDEKADMYFANKTLLYKVMGHLSVAELKIVDAIHEESRMMQADWHVQNNVERMLKKALQDTQKEFKY